MPAMQKHWNKDLSWFNLLRSFEGANYFCVCEFSAQLTLINITTDSVKKQLLIKAFTDR